ncbi:MAG: RagB/SusD family nutrient uptake outer membrane protein [Flavisolibacter sp.]
MSATLVVMMGSCKKDFITIQPQGQFLTDNYYTNRDQAYAGLVAAYDVMRKNAGGFENMITMMNAGSDDNYAGGGGPTDGIGIQSFSNFTINPNTVPRSFWSDHYQGIFRTNILLQKLPNIPMDAGEKARFTAEMKALRATYYFNLVRMFRNVPLLLQPVGANDIYNVTQSPPAAVYAQIEKDLNEAIPNLPSSVVLSTEAGRFTKVAAQAQLGKVYLYDNKKSEAAAMLAQVNGTPGQPNQYGNRLLPKFSDLWVFTNKFNAESLLECVHTNQSNADWGFWGSSADEGNTAVQMVGPRSYQKVGPNAPDIYPSGWSFNPWTQDFYDLIKNDPRFSSTVLDLKALAAAGEARYIEGYMNTGYFLYKMIPRRSDIRTGGGAVELNFQMNDYIIRLADTYLLEAEALGGTGARAQALLDAVRARVGLPSVPVSLDAIKTERRLELAGEGHRFFDLVRWGDAPAKLGSRGFQAGKNEVFPIPAQELQGTKLVQNPNY